MHTVFALLCFVVVIHWLIFPYPSGLLHWHCGNLTIAPVPAKQPWWIWINTSCEFIMNDCITTTTQSTTKPFAYFLGYTVCVEINPSPPGQNGHHFTDNIFRCIHSWNFSGEKSPWVLRSSSGRSIQIFFHPTGRPPWVAGLISASGPIVLKSFDLDIRYSGGDTFHNSMEELIGCHKKP